MLMDFYKIKRKEEREKAAFKKRSLQET